MPKETLREVMMHGPSSPDELDKGISGQEGSTHGLGV